MTFNLQQAEKGCLLLADITGYTSYLQGTELEHAEDVLSDLLETIVAQLEPIFILSKLEGDAAFAYAPRATVSPSMIMDTVETAYFAFQRRLRDVTHSTTCDCNACVLIPSLDLKFLVHDGQYVIRRIARSEELTGPDVILVHRLLKGTAGQAVNGHAYAAYTTNTLASMQMNPSILGFVSHTDVFDDIGEVEVFVQDLSARWAFENERHRDYVTPDQAALNQTWEVNAPGSVVWDYLTDPAKRLQWQHGTTSIDMVTEGRLGIGTINHCMHGPNTVIEHVSDWRPFSYITSTATMPGMSDQADPIKTTIELEMEGDLTRVSVRIADPGPEVWSAMGPELERAIMSGGDRLKELVTSDERLTRVPAARA